MPDIVHKIDVTSALIHYEGNWFSGSAVQFPPGNTFSDPDLGKHDQGTSVLCFPDKDHVCSATLNFTGTEIRVVGAYRGQLAPGGIGRGNIGPDTGFNLGPRRQSSSSSSTSKGRTISIPESPLMIRAAHSTQASPNLFLVVTLIWLWAGKQPSQSG
ncbi:hypothetical protein C8J57DRAFT_1656009 [Mycena rebaudengoi]|nr:hypothetical protein C8J57DRAFT_1656009 [Mycena rebaudengoi]